MPKITRKHALYMIPVGGRRHRFFATLEDAKAFVQQEFSRTGVVLTIVTTHAYDRKTGARKNPRGSGTRSLPTKLRRRRTRASAMKRNPGVLSRMYHGAKAGVYAGVASAVQRRSERAREKAFANPPLAVFGNPKGGKAFGDIIEIRYRHRGDGKNYKHAFKRGQVKICGVPDSTIVYLERVDGQPIISEYDV